MIGGYRLVGRDDELSHLHRRMAEAVSGSGGVVFIEGEAGIGKSLLSAHLLLESGIEDTAVGRCRGQGETPPFGPWLELISSLSARGVDAEPPLEAAAAGLQRSAQELAVATVAWFRQVKRPLLLLLEDIQWADSASLELLRNLTPLLARSHVLILATCRSDEVGRQHPLWSLLPNLQRSGAERLPLPRLSEASVAPLLTAAASELGVGAERALRGLYQRTGGHPLFLMELLAALRRHGPQAADRHLPDSVLQAIDLKLEVVSADTYGVLSKAALIGERFHYDLLTAAADQPDTTVARAIDEALGARLIRADGVQVHQYTFDHALVREALLSRLSLATRREWHVRIAEVLIRKMPQAVDATALHLSLAGDPRSVEWLLLAGDRALRLGATAHARQRYERALQMLDGPDDRRGELLLKLGHAVCYHDADQAWEYWQSALEAATEAGDEVVAVWSRHFLLKEMFRRGLPTVLAEMERLEAAQSRLLENERYRTIETELFGHRCGYPRIAGERARALGLAGRTVELTALLDTVLATATPGPDLVDLIYARYPSAINAGEIDRCTEILRQVREQRLQLRQYRLAAAMQFNRLFVLLHYRSERVDEIDAAAQQLLQDHQISLDRAGEGTVRGEFSPLGIYQFMRGEWQDARQNLLGYYRAHPDEDHPLRRTAAATLAREIGNPALSLSLLAGLKPQHPAEPRANYLSVFAVTGRVDAHIDLGEFGPASDWLASAERLTELLQSKPLRGVARICRARLHQVTGDLDMALRTAESAVPILEGCGYTYALMQAYRRAGEIAFAMGKTAPAQSYLGRALLLSEASRFPYETALCNLALGEFSADRTAAAAHLTAARDVLERLDAAPAYARAVAAVNRLSAADLLHGSAGNHRLTDGEVKIARLVAQGCTDKEISASLFISTRTVDRHLRNIFNKLSISSRSALGAYAARHGLID